MKCLASGVLLPLVIFFTVLSISLAGDTIDHKGSVSDGDTLVSAEGNFELGFFSPGASKKRYVGIWFKKVPFDNIVWVANRRAPLNDSTGVLKFGEGGSLVIVDKAGVVLWSSPSVASAAGVSNPVAQLLDSGNLIIKDGGGSKSDTPYLWQSFDEPGNSMIAGMRLGVDRKTGLNRYLVSWSSPDDPAPGSFTVMLETNKLPRLVVKRGSTLQSTTGPWNGIQFSSLPEMQSSGICHCNVVSNQDEVYYYFTNGTSSWNWTYSVLTLQPNGAAQHLVWNDHTSTWNAFIAGDRCDAFAACGPNGICNLSSSPVCQCPRGFRPRSPEDWYVRDASGGCVREEKLQCGGDEGFLRLDQVKVPDTTNATVDMSVGLDKCRDRCARSCSCTAYARADVRLGVLSGCITWSGDLIDMRTIAGGQQELYLRVPASLLDATGGDNRGSKRKLPAVAVAAVSVASGLLFLALCGCGIWIKKKITTTKTKPTGNRDKIKTSVVAEDADLPLLDFETIASATNNFSFRNKVGEGGFGVVYKGALDDGQEIAVKRLSYISVQGVNDFMNEARLTAKLQHKNLVRLLGCCISGEERMLIYEYMHNKSLEFFIFDQRKRALLDWRTCLGVILGIARGLMYLHHDSRLKIIHRDLKASNILLDEAMNPKISDFGTARIFGANQNVDSTKRVIGTYGYMSPEYVINGIISVKSDVFSFGVLTLEILSGIKCRDIYENDPESNLLLRAWKLWQEGNWMELLDETLASSCSEAQIMRCIHIALLCVQGHPEDRPIMSIVVMMLSSEIFPLAQPKEPGFLVLRGYNSSNISCSSKEEFTENAITVTIEGR